MSTAEIAEAYKDKYCVPYGTVGRWLNEGRTHVYSDLQRRGYTNEMEELTLLIEGAIAAQGADFDRYIEVAAKDVEDAQKGAES